MTIDSISRAFAILISLYLVSFSSDAIVEAIGLNQKLLVVSFDGFRQSYFNDNRFLPWFSYFRQGGVFSDQMQSAFPSETFPNHYSIVTGMYPESHGIVSNKMYDPATGLTFSKMDLNPIWWDQAEPIWVTAERQKKRTAVSFWPGSAVKFPPDGMTPTYYRPDYDESVPFELRINETVNHLANDNVDLAFLYYWEPDSDGHNYGIQSTEVNDELQLVDWYLSYLLKRLDEVGLGNDVLNVILCADHGMTNVTHFEYLEDYASLTDDIERMPSYGPVANIQPKSDKIDVVFNSLSKAANAGAPFKVYKKADVPAELHYSNNARIFDIIVICDLNVYFQPSRKATWIPAGAHGYDPRLPAMRPMFMARGPAFKSYGYRAASSYETKDIYAIIAHVVGIEPKATNATLENALDIFSSASPPSKVSFSLLPLSFMACFIIQTITDKINF